MLASQKRELEKESRGGRPESFPRHSFREREKYVTFLNHF